VVGWLVFGWTLVIGWVLWRWYARRNALNPMARPRGE
jgi:hypothetical protein